MNYSKIPAGFKNGYNLRDLPTSPPERAKEHSNGAMPVAKSSGASGKAETGTARNEQMVSGSQPVRMAQAGDAGMNDGFWIKALVTSDLAIYEGNKPIMTGSVEAVDALYRHVMKSSQNDGKGKAKEKEAEKGKISGTTDHAEERKDQAAGGDKSREVGDANRVVREGRRLQDSESGHDVYVNGDRVVIVDLSGAENFLSLF